MLENCQDKKCNKPPKKKERKKKKNIMWEVNKILRLQYDKS